MATALLGLMMAVQLQASAWLIDAPQLRPLLEANAVTVLDARSAREYDRGHLPGAVHVDWTDFRDGWGRTGALSAQEHKLAARLAARGVDARRPVIVYGAARDGWGEEGRIAWMLHYLGHPDVRVLDGGVTAWRAVGGAIDRARVRPRAGTFVASVVPRVRTRLPEVATIVGLPGEPPAHAMQRPLLLDVRPRDEWDGARHYREPRVGHIPGAVRFDWRDLLDPSGRLRPRDTLLPLLAARGITPERTIVVYCTGGVRSAEAFWMLRALGFADVRNYDGSWYEWGFDRTKPAAVGGPDDGSTASRP